MIGQRQLGTFIHDSYSATAGSQPNPKQFMRVMTFNIFEGGDSLLQNKIYRRDLIAKIVRTADADVVALQECTGWEQHGEKTLHEFEEEVGMLALIAVTNGFPVALLVKPDYGIVFADALTQGFWHGTLEVVVADANNQTTRFLNVHLHPSDPHGKFREMRSILGRYSQNERTIILGDMNSISHLDNVQLRNLSQATQSSHMVQGKLDVRVSRSLEEAGFVDAYAALHDGKLEPTIPTAAARTSKFSPARLDYIYVSSDLRKSIASIEVLRTEDTECASDHYPLVMDLTDHGRNGQVPPESIT